MNKISIDLSMRSSGLAYFYDDKLEDFSLVSNSTLNDEELISSNCNKIIHWIRTKCEPDIIRIEGLSFGSISGSKDIIAGQFWLLRCKIKENFPKTVIEIIPVTSWRSPLFSKEDRLKMKDAKANLKRDKKKLKGLKGTERKEAMLFNANLEDAASIKEQTWSKLDEETHLRILTYLAENRFDMNGRYDITDSIFLGMFKKK